MIINSLEQRASNYNTIFEKFSKQSPLITTDRWLFGVWMIGNDYHGVIRSTNHRVRMVFIWQKIDEIRDE